MKGYPVFIMRLVTVKLPRALIEGLDDLIQTGMYQSRSAAVRTAVRELLRKELWEKG
jgi:Arc/MetJ-type ribon-helix-helix transcriptional regulator